MLLLKINKHLLECGTDEAGRGCLAGPVTAAAVILPNDFQHPFLTDSKQLSEKKRLQLKEIIEREAICFKVVHVMMDEIDKINILNASILGMHRAIDGLSCHPEFIAIDGNRFKPFGKTPFQCVVKGDGKFLHIAAASIWQKPIATNICARYTSNFHSTIGSKTKDTQRWNTVRQSAILGAPFIIVKASNFYLLNLN